MIKKFIKNTIGKEKADFEKYLKKINTFGFDILKLEKDFYLTFVLGVISTSFPELIFKWWTCLNKVYLDYFRLSEDLDFDLILTGGDNVRKRTLKQYVQSFKEKFQELGLIVKGQESYTLKNNTRLKMDFTYISMVDATQQEIKIEISVKDKKYLTPVKMPIKSVFIDLFSENPLFETQQIACLDFKEAVAEKMRAALTRTAIRDFFDIRYIKQSTDFVFDHIKDIVVHKLAESNYEYVIDDEETLEKQINTHLNQVLWKKHTFWKKELQETYEFILTFKI